MRNKTINFLALFVMLWAFVIAPSAAMAQSGSLSPGARSSGTITAANVGTTPATLTPGSYIQVFSPYGSIQLHVDITGSSSNTYQLWEVSNGVKRVIPLTTLTNLVTGDTSGPGTGPDGAWYGVYPGAGSFYLVCTAYTANQTVSMFTGQGSPGGGGGGGGGGSVTISGSLPSGSNTIGNLNYGAQNWQTASWTSATSTGTNLAVNTQNMTTGVVTVVVPSGISGGVLEFSGYDGLTWFHIPGSLDGSNTASNLSAVNSPFTLVTNTQSLMRFPVAGLQQFRVNLKTAITGSGTVSVNLGASAGPSVDRIVGVSSLPALPSGSNTIGSVNVLGGNATAVKTDGSAVTQPVSAASLPLPTGAATSANQTSVISTAGSASASVVNVQGSASGTAIPVSMSTLPSGSNTIGSVNILAPDATAALSLGALNASAQVTMAGYYGAGFSFTGTFTGTLVAEWSPDNTNWYNVPIVNVATQVVYTAGASSAGGYSIMSPGGAGYVRVRCSSYSSGTATGTLRATISQMTTWHYLAGSLPTGSNTIGSVNLANGISAGAPVFSVPSVSTANGLSSVYQNAALSTTVQSVKVSAGNFYGYNFYNPNAAAVTLEVFNVASGSVTLGTTTPFWHITIPAGATGHLSFPFPLSLSTAISVACVTTYNGSTAPATGLDLTVIYN